MLIPISSLSQIPNNYYIVSIGVNNYEDPFWPTLKWPANDAAQIAERIGINTTHQVHKFVFTNTDSSGENIKTALGKIENQAQSSDTVILYISSHGTLAQNTSGELERIVVLNDTKNSDLLNTGLTHRYIYAWLDRLKARKKLAIFATCHSGEGKSRLPSYIRNIIYSQKGKLLPLSEASEGTLILAAAAKGESAREDDLLHGDIYTHYLIEALTTYDRNKDGMVTALEAHDYAREKTWGFTHGQQRPTSNATLIGDADVPLFGKKYTMGLPILEAYDEKLSGYEVQVDGGLKGRLPMAFPLHPDGNKVTLYSLKSNKPLARYQIKLPLGSAITLEKIMTSRPIGVSIQELIYNWKNSDLQKLTGKSGYATTRAWFALFKNPIGFGISTSLPTRKRTEIRPSLESRTRFTDILLSVQYEYRLLHVSILANVQAGFEQLQVKFMDTSLNRSLVYSTWDTTYGFNLGVAYNFQQDFSISLTYGWNRSTYELDKLKNFSGDGTRTWYGIGFNYRFNPKIRTL